MNTTEQKIKKTGVQPTLKNINRYRLKSLEGCRYPIIWVLSFHLRNTSLTYENTNIMNLTFLPAETQIPPFVKFCDRRFNIARDCRTLQLGTPQYFREAETRDGVGDPVEGIGHRIVRPSVDENGNRQFANVDHYFGPSSLLFCSTILKNKNDEDPPFNDYNDKYFIKDIRRFQKIIRDELQRILQPSMLKMPDAPVNEIEVLARTGVVEYVKEYYDDLLYTESSYFNSMLRKPERFSSQKEVRTIFLTRRRIPNGQDGVYGFQDTPFLLDLTPVYSELRHTISLDSPFAL